MSETNGKREHRLVYHSTHALIGVVWDRHAYSKGDRIKHGGAAFDVVDVRRDGKTLMVEYAEGDRAQVVTVYEAKGDKDKQEGRGGTYLIGTFRTEVAAKLAARGHGVMGTSGYVHGRRALLVDGEYWPLAGDAPLAIADDPEEATRQRALAKLTPEERAALGIA